jgi:hypothetical protein
MVPNDVPGVPGMSGRVGIPVTPDPKALPGAPGMSGREATPGGVWPEGAVPGPIPVAPLVARCAYPLVVAADTIAAISRTVPNLFMIVLRPLFGAFAAPGHCIPRGMQTHLALTSTPGSGLGSEKARIRRSSAGRGFHGSGASQMTEIEKRPHQNGKQRAEPDHPHNRCDCARRQHGKQSLGFPARLWRRSDGVVTRRNGGASDAEIPGVPMPGSHGTRSFD